MNELEPGTSPAMNHDKNISNVKSFARCTLAFIFEDNGESFAPIPDIFPAPTTSVTTPECYICSSLELSLGYLTSPNRRFPYSRPPLQLLISLT